MGQIETIQPFLEPIRKSIVVSQSPEVAFQLFTAGMADWWPTSRFSVSQDRVSDVVVEPRVGGAVYEVRDDGETFPWGAVIVWEPNRCFAMTWHPGRTSDTAQEVEVRFIAEADGTRVELEHRNWQALGDRAGSTREQYLGGWDFVFGQCFADACAA